MDKNNLVMSILRKISIAVFCSFAITNLSAQDDEFNDLKRLVGDSKEELEALALYPDDMRDAIFELCLYPELLVRLGAIQSKTQESFQEIIQYQPEETQKKYWELLRYPGLINSLVVGGQKGRNEIEKVLKDYPSEVHDVALDYGVSRLRTLEKINDINKEAESALELLLVDYKKDTADKTRLLLKFPEVLHIMVEHVDIAILVGEYYKKDPELLREKARSLKLEVAQNYQNDVQEWKKGLEEDPMALKEFEEVSQEFKDNNEHYSDNDNDPMYPNSSKPDNQVAQKSTNETNIYVQYDYYPYPFWYGYPIWFPHVYWYRYPYWYHSGFYYANHNSMVIFGLPSYYYFYWYFDYPTHYYRYPYLSNYIIRYYRTHRGAGPSRSTINSSVENWKNNSRSRIPNYILNEENDAVRRRKLEEYGRFEENYRKRVERNPGLSVTPDQYLEQNRNRYQYLSGENRTIRENAKQKPAPRIQYNIITTRPSRSVELNRAREQHQRTWEGSKYNNRSRSTPKPSAPQPTRKSRREK